MAAKTDRRSRRTRRSLHQALIAAVLEKGYGRVTVQDILDRADIGRSTFYTHYRSKDELLLDSGRDHLRDLLADNSSERNDLRDWTSALRPALTLFRLANDNRELYRALIGRRGSDLIIRMARRMLNDVFTEHLHTRLDTRDQHQLEITVEFLVNGLIGLLTWWLDTKASLSAAQMYAHFERIAARGISPSLIDPPDPPAVGPSHTPTAG